MFLIVFESPKKANSFKKSKDLKIFPCTLTKGTFIHSFAKFTIQIYLHIVILRFFRHNNKDIINLLINIRFIHSHLIFISLLIRIVDIVDNNKYVGVRNIYHDSNIGIIIELCTKQRLPVLDNNTKQTTAEQKTPILMFQSHKYVVRLVCRFTAQLVYQSNSMSSYCETYEG